MLSATGHAPSALGPRLPPPAAQLEADALGNYGDMRLDDVSAGLAFGGLRTCASELCAAWWARLGYEGALQQGGQGAVWGVAAP